MRSIERGLGPSKLKDSFDLTLLRTIWDLPNFENVEDDYIMVLSGSWFPMREIELANAKASHIRFEHTSSDNPVVHWSLPVFKTDTKGEMIERSHTCSCSAEAQRKPSCPVESGRKDPSRTYIPGTRPRGAPCTEIRPGEIGFSHVPPLGTGRAPICPVAFPPRKPVQE